MVVNPSAAPRPFLGGTDPVKAPTRAFYIAALSIIFFSWISLVAISADKVLTLNMNI